MASYRAVRGGIVVAVRLTPRAAGDSVDGTRRLPDGSEVLIARVRAVPSGGAANEALIALLAKVFHVPKSSVRIVAGAGARLKQAEIRGETAALSAMINGWPRLS